MVSIYKKYVGVNGAIDKGSMTVLAECVRCYAGLAVLGGWSEWEDEESFEGLRRDGANGGVGDLTFSPNNGMRRGFS